MTKKQHGARDTDRVLERDRTDPGEVAAGDAQLDTEPPGVMEAEPPPAAGDEADAEVDAVADVRQIESDMDTLRRDFTSLSDRHIRLAAEFDNYRKRVERERAEAWSRAQADLAGRLLDALDDLRRVSDHAETSSAEALAQGVILVERKLRQALQAAGLEPIEAEGARFDPNSMEAVAMLPTEAREEDDTVSDVFQPGYRFKGTLLRPARVRVRKHGA